MSKIVSFLSFVAVTICVDFRGVNGRSVLGGKSGGLHFALTARNDGGRDHAALHDGVFDLAHLELCVEIGFHYR